MRCVITPIDSTDGYVIVCFGAPGSLAVRELTRCLVISITEVAMHAASLISTNFLIVTTLNQTRIIAQQLVENYGMTKFRRNIHRAELFFVV